MKLKIFWLCFTTFVFVYSCLYILIVTQFVYLSMPICLLRLLPVRSWPLHAACNLNISLKTVLQKYKYKYSRNWKYKYSLAKNKIQIQYSQIQNKNTVEIENTCSDNLSFSSASLMFSPSTWIKLGNQKSEIRIQIKFRNRPILHFSKTTCANFFWTIARSAAGALFESLSWMFSLSTRITIYVYNWRFLSWWQLTSEW